MSHYLFAESNTTGTGEIALSRLSRAGHQVTFFTRDRSRYPFLESPAPGVAVREVETNDAADLARAVAQTQRQEGADALLTFSDFYVDIVARVAAELGFPYLSPRAAATCRNKHLTRQALRRHGLPTPEFWRLTSVAEAERLGTALRYPCVVKPPSDSSSFGVKVANDAAELVAQFRLLAALATNVRGQRLDGSVLVESYLEGPETSVETVTLPGGELVVVGVTDKHLSPPPHFVEMGHEFPSALPAEVREELVEAVRRGLAAVGFDFGPAHTEVRLTPAGPVIVEINPRLAGGMIPELVRHATGIDLLDALLDLLVGRKPRLEADRREVAGVRFLTAGRTGRLTAVSGLEEAGRLPRVREVALTKGMGSLVQPPENAYHRLGHIIAAGPSRAAVVSDLEEARRIIRLEVQEGTAGP